MQQQNLFKTPSNFNLLSMYATHSGGKGEYLHDWYAYLEGYSSEFVKSVYTNYMPKSQLILEPFAGVGTTPLTLSLAGINCVYAEVNPAMRRVVSTKLAVATLPEKRKELLFYDLNKLSEKLPNLVAKSKADIKLTKTYQLAFKNSKFFFDKTYCDVLKLRSLNDKIQRKNPLLGSALEIAIIAKLVECSKLKRAGDVRYKTKKELEKGIPNLIESVQTQLAIMAYDCKVCPQSTGSANINYK